MCKYICSIEINKYQKVVEIGLAIGNSSLVRIPRCSRKDLVQHSPEQIR